MLSYADTILEIEILQRGREVVECAMLHLDSDQDRDRASLLYDELSDQIAALRADLDDYEQDMAMRERARDRAYGRWITR